MPNAMPTLATLALCALLAPQSDPARQARELVEKLSSESVEEREKASQSLLRMDRGILPFLRRERAQARDKETQGRIADVIEAMASIAIHAPGLPPGAADALKGVLDGKDKEAHVVVFSSLGKALDSKAELLILWPGGDEQEVGAGNLEKLPPKYALLCLFTAGGFRDAFLQFRHHAGQRGEPLIYGLLFLFA